MQQPLKYRIRQQVFLVTLAILIAAAIPSAQTFSAQIQQFWNELRTGAIAFSTGRVQTSGYLNFGNTVGTNGYGVRDSAGTMQFKNSGGAWAAFLSSSGNLCPGDGTTVIKQVATNDLGIYTGATACVGGTLRFDVSATGVTADNPTFFVDSVNHTVGLGTITPWTAGSAVTIANPAGGGGVTVGTVGYAWNAGASHPYWHTIAATASFRWVETGVADDRLVIKNGGTGAGVGIDVASPAYPLDVLGEIHASGALTAGATSRIQWTGLGGISEPANGIFKFNNAADTVAFRIDGSVSGTAAFQSGSGTDTAVVRANVLNITGSTPAYQIGGALAISGTAPTVSAGFGSMVAGTVTKNTGTIVVMVTVGTNAGGTTGTLTFPTALTGWACHLDDVTTTTDLTRQTGYTQTTAAFSTTVAWTTGDVLVGVCGPF